MAPMKELLEEIQGHLGAALIQSLPSDDQIIIEHIRVAKALVSIAQEKLDWAVKSRLHDHLENV